MTPGQLLIRLLIYGLPIVVSIAALVSVFRTPAEAFDNAQRGSKVLWIVLTALTVVGSFVYFLWVRPQTRDPNQQSIGSDIIATLSGRPIGMTTAMEQIVVFGFYILGIAGMALATITTSWLIFVIAAIGLSAVFVRSIAINT